LLALDLDFFPDLHFGVLASLEVLGDVAACGIEDDRSLLRIQPIRLRLLLNHYQRRIPAGELAMLYKRRFRRFLFKGFHSLDDDLSSLEIDILDS
jgi:hypothetical protein